MPRNFPALQFHSGSNGAQKDKDCSGIIMYKAKIDEAEDLGNLCRHCRDLASTEELYGKADFQKSLVASNLPIWLLETMACSVPVHCHKRFILWLRSGYQRLTPSNALLADSRKKA